MDDHLAVARRLAWPVDGRINLEFEHDTYTRLTLYCFRSISNFSLSCAYCRQIIHCLQKTSDDKHQSNIQRGSNTHMFLAIASLSCCFPIVHEDNHTYHENEFGWPKIHLKLNFCLQDSMELMRKITNSSREKMLFGKESPSGRGLREGGPGRFMNAAIACRVWRGREGAAGPVHRMTYE